MVFKQKIFADVFTVCLLLKEVFSPLGLPTYALNFLIHRTYFSIFKGPFHFYDLSQPLSLHCLVHLNVPTLFKDAELFFDFCNAHCTWEPVLWARLCITTRGQSSRERSEGGERESGSEWEDVRPPTPLPCQRRNTRGERLETLVSWSSLERGGVGRGGMKVRSRQGRVRRKEWDKESERQNYVGQTCF